jgi:hypothetical protein
MIVMYIAMHMDNSQYNKHNTSNKFINDMCFVMVSRWPMEEP